MDLILAFMVAARIAVHATSGFLLFSSWFRGKKRFFSDLPFVFALMFVTLATGKIIDLGIIMTSPTGDPATVAMDILLARYFFIALNAVEILAAVLVIWNRSRDKLNAMILIGYSIAWMAALWLATGYVQLARSIYLFLPAMLMLMLTFLFIYRQKRLVNQLNALHVFVGLVIYAASQLLRPILVSIGGVILGSGWINEIIELVGMTITFWGFFKPARVALRGIKEAALVRK